MMLLEKYDINNKDDFAIIVKNIENQMYIYAIHRIGNHCDVNDIIQDTIVKIYKYRHCIREKDCFEAWYMSILRNECNRYYREKRRDKLLLEKIYSVTDLNPVDYSICDFENSMYFNQCLNKLKPTDREIFVLHYQCRCTIKDVALILGINENTIKSKLRRCKDKLNELKKDGDSHEK